MYDVEIALDDQPGALAELAETLGRAGVSIEGGGAFVLSDRAAAHFLFHDGPAAARVLESAGIRVVQTRPVLLHRLNQDVPGQLGAVCRQLADSGINIQVQYSDHANQLVLVVDKCEQARDLLAAWQVSD